MDKIFFKRGESRRERAYLGVYIIYTAPDQKRIFKRIAVEAR